MTTTEPAPGLSPEALTLARRLLAQAAEVLPRLPLPAREEVRPAIEAFAAAPGPASYLRAAQTLSARLKAHLVHEIAGATARKGLDEGLARLGRAPGIDEAVLAQLSTALPLDLRIGDRLTSLAFLLEAFDELAGRVTVHREQMRRRMRGVGRRSKPASPSRR